MRRRTLVLGVLGTPVAIALLWVAVHWSVLSSFPRMPSAYESKEYCSCRWVEERDDAFCANFVYQDVVPSQGRVVEEATRRVTAQALWTRTSARWVSERAGCVSE